MRRADPTATGARVRWGVLGAGRVVRELTGPALSAAPGSAVAAVASSDPARAAAALPGARVHARYADLLDDEAVDAVYIALANDAHADWVVRALESGCHVLCEKPLALTAAEVDRLTAAARATGRTVTEAMWNRWHPRTRAAERLLRDGLVGRVRSVRAVQRTRDIPPGDIRRDPARGGGALLDVGCYAVTAVLWAVDAGPPAEVRTLEWRTAGGVDVAATAHLDWPDGTTATVEVRLGGGSAQELTVTGTAGTLSVSPFPFTAKADTQTQLLLDGESVWSGRGDGFGLMASEVSSALAGGPGWLQPLAFSRDVAAVLDAVRASGAAGGSPAPVRQAPGPEAPVRQAPVREEE